MEISKKIFLIVVCIIVVVVTVIPITLGIMYLNNPINDPNHVKIYLMQTKTGKSMSCIVIEANDKRIYIDAYEVPDEYQEKPANVIFITHPHDDHYDPDSIDLIKQDSTIFIGPKSCEEYINLYDVIGVEPGDTGEAAGFSYEAIPAYSISTDTHPKEEKWCGYILTVNGLRILHCGDSGCIEEYESYVGTIDVACLPVGMACSNMGPEGSLDAIEIFEPKYVIPYHHQYQILNEWKSQVESRFPGMYVHLNSGFFQSDPLIICPEK